MSKNSIALKLITKLTNGKGRTKLDNLINKIKETKLNENNCDIYIVTKYNTPNPEIVKITWKKAMDKGYIEDFEVILQENILQPQMTSNFKHYVPIYDDDFSYSGKIIKKSNLVHFFLSNKKTNKRLQILVQKGKTGFFADKFIQKNGKKFYDI
jgi:hypothetical protein